MDSTFRVWSSVSEKEGAVPLRGVATENPAQGGSRAPGSTRAGLQRGLKVTRGAAAQPAAGMSVLRPQDQLPGLNAATILVGASRPLPPGPPLPSPPLPGCASAARSPRSSGGLRALFRKRWWAG